MPLKGFGRLAYVDGRDKNFSIAPIARAIAERRALPKEKLWPQDGWWGDQGETPRCTAFAWNHFLADFAGFPAPKADVDLTRFYCAEQTVDPWPGDCDNQPKYDGTTVRAGAKIAVRDGEIVQYSWAFDIFAIRDVIAFHSPLVIGIDWYESMSDPDKHGVVKVRGSIEGGHALLINGFIKRRDSNHWYRLKNSWGKSWGDNGNAWIQQRELAKLVKSDAEFCVPQCATPAVPQAMARVESVPEFPDNEVTQRGGGALAGVR